MNRLRQRIVLVARYGIGGEAHLAGLDFTVDLALVFDDARRNTHRSRAGRNITHHHGIRSDLGAFAQGNRPQHLGSGADHHAALQRGVSPALVP